MSRLPSIDIPKALYYVQMRSNGHCQLLASREEFSQFPPFLASLCRESGGCLIAYCLFQDSLHAVIRAGDQGIALITQGVIEQHTQHYNRIHQRHGSLYSQQVVTVLIDPQEYLLPVIYKLHWLPVKAGLVSAPLAYPWSSHRDYLAADAPDWLDRQEVLVRVANHRASQLRRYEHFIDNSQPAPLDWETGVCLRYRALASDAYIDKLLQQKHASPDKPTLDLNALTEWICREYELDEKDLLLRRYRRLGGEVQAMVGALAIAFKIATLAQVADYFASDEDVLASGIRALKERRGMYLFKLQSQLDNWLNHHEYHEPQIDTATHFSKTTTLHEDEAQPPLLEDVAPAHFDSAPLATHHAR